MSLTKSAAKLGFFLKKQQRKTKKSSLDAPFFLFLSLTLSYFMSRSGKFLSQQTYNLGNFI